MQGIARKLLSQEMQEQILKTKGSLANFAQIVVNLQFEHLEDRSQLLEQQNSLELSGKDLELSGKDQEILVQRLTFDLKEVNGELMRVSGYLGGRGLLGKDHICSGRIVSHLTPAIILDKLRSGPSDL